VAIAPHDDYTYASFMYPLVLANVKAPTVLIFGVAHKARTFSVENRLVFDSFTHWRGPYGNITVSALREALMGELEANAYVVHDELQSVEHSVEAKLPFLQHYNRDVQLVSILVPAMPHARMGELAPALARAIAKATRARGWEWGRDFAVLISTDAVHYGDEGWGGKNFAQYGADETGYRQAVAHDRQLMKKCFAGSSFPPRPRSSRGTRFAKTITANTSGPGAAGIRFPSECSCHGTCSRFSARRRSWGKSSATPPRSIRRASGSTTSMAWG
jgi:AmmeMemoRadiSam system protein B